MHLKIYKEGWIILGALTTHTQNNKTKTEAIEHILNISVSNRRKKGEKDRNVLY